MRTKLTLLLTICLLTVGVIACDVSGEQNYDFKVGNSLAIEGPTLVTVMQDTTTADSNDVVPTTASYNSKAFTIDKDYSWSVSGSGTKDKVYREGEFLDVTFGNVSGNDTTTTTISVDDGEYQGEITVKATRQRNADL